MDEQITLYFGSVAEALIAVAVLTLSGAALTNGYYVLKNHHQRSSRLSGRSPAWNSFSTWLLITVEIVLTVHVIKAIVAPNWITLMIGGAIAIIQLVLNAFIVRDIKAAYLPLRTDSV